MKQIFTTLAFLLFVTLSFAQQWGAVTLVSPDPVPDPLRTDGTHYYFTFKYDDLTDQNENVGLISITPVKGEVIIEGGPWINGSLFQYELSFTGEDKEAVFSVTAKNTDGNNQGTWHSGNLALPVELISFDVRDNTKNLELTWSTASEIRNDFFTVERSTDGRNFSSIGIIDGAGSTSEKTDYSYTDNSIKKMQSVTTVYYRLMQTDLDGKTTYSPIISAKTGAGSQLEIGKIKQLASNLEVSFYAGNNTPTVITVFDMSGKVIASNRLTPSKGSNTTLFNSSSLSHGIYVVNINNGITTSSKKFLK